MIINHIHGIRCLILSPALARLKHYISPDKKYSLHLIIYLAAPGKARMGLISGTATWGKIQLLRLVFSVGLHRARTSQASKCPLLPCLIGHDSASQGRSPGMAREKSRDIRSMDP